MTQFCVCLQLILSLKASATSTFREYTSVYSITPMMWYSSLSNVCQCAYTLSSSLVRLFSLVETPSSPSVSSTMARRSRSYAAHTPAVHDDWRWDVLNTSAPPNRVWFSVWDFPSPVLPNIETTFTGALTSQPSRPINSSLSRTCHIYSTITTAIWISKALSSWYVPDKWVVFLCRCLVLLLFLFVAMFSFVSVRGLGVLYQSTDWRIVLCQLQPSTAAAEQLIIIHNLHYCSPVSSSKQLD